MDFTTIGWLLTMANLQSLGGPKYQLKDMSVEVDKVSVLKELILKHPGFSADNFRKGSFYRNGDIAIFVSSPLRNYLTGVSSNPDEKALLIVLLYEPRQYPYTNSLDSGNNLPYHVFLAAEDVEEKVARKLLKFADDSYQKPIDVNTPNGHIHEYKV